MLQWHVQERTILKLKYKLIKIVLQHNKSTPGSKKINKYSQANNSLTLFNFLYFIILSY